MGPSAPSSLGPAQLEGYRELVERAFAFGMSPEHWARFLSGFGEENIRLWEPSGRIEAGLGFYRMGHYVGGRAVSAAGIAGVASRPESRGQGHVAALLEATLRELQGEGVGLATLYASTQGPYRKVGFEEAGLRNRFTLSATQLRPAIADEGVSVEEVADEERADLEPVYERFAQRQQGMLVRSPGLWMRVFTVHSGSEALCYRVREAGEITGYIVYQQREAPRGFDVFVRDRAWLTAAAGRELWRLLHGQRSLAREITWFGPAPDPWTLLLPEANHRATGTHTWMQRIVDVKTAFEARGFAPGVSETLELELDDSVIEANAGRWRLHISEGRARAEKGGDGTLRLGVQGLASLYTGFATPAELRVAGCSRGRTRSSRARRGPSPGRGRG